MTIARNVVPRSIAIAFVLLGALLFQQDHAYAADPRMIITWEAATYAPAGFQGRTFPTSGSTVRASVALIDGSSFVDLSRERIYWYANGELIVSAVGASSVSFIAPAVIPATIVLRAELPDRGTGAALIKTIEIPVVRPEAVAALLSAESGEKVLAFAALPYFFNVRSPLDLSYAWSVRGASAPTREDPHKLSIVLSESGAPVSVNLIVRNPAKLRESASRFFSL